MQQLDAVQNDIAALREELGVPGRVVVKTLTGQQMNIEIKENFTGWDIKSAIMSLTGFECSSQRLIFNGKQLDDSSPISSCGIGNRSVVCVSLVVKPSHSALPTDRRLRCQLRGIAT